MKKLVFALAVAAASAPLHAQAAKSDVARWQREAQNVDIIRDDWGIAHVYGKTDADAVFGMIYAQSEDDFNRVETNFINSLGRMAEVTGEADVYKDLRMKLFIDPDSLKKEYAGSPASLKKLMDAWADGLNFYLYKHPEVKPLLLTHFEPWMALSFSEGSIGGDIEHVQVPGLQAFYSNQPVQSTPSNEDLGIYEEPSGSNGIAIAPKNTLDHHALLWINPHTSFFFRSELQMVSNEGLDAYGAVTWGQFFIYQGFNPELGWMHTTSNADDLDEYAETVTEKNGKYFYKYGNEEKPFITKTITVPYKSGNGMASKTFTVYYSQHGPVIRKTDDKWITIHIMVEHVKALTQSYVRTKAKSLAEFEKDFDLHTNSSNNTLYADKDGNIAMFYGNFVPKRDPKFDWTKPVDGSNPATDWHGLLSFNESPNSINPSTGWVFNVNNWPWSAAGPASPKASDYPPYVEQSHFESPRGVHALRLLPGHKDFTSVSLMHMAFDSYLPSFALIIPPLIKAYDALPASDPMKTKLAEPIEQLRHWDFRWSGSSIPTSLASFYGDDLGRRIGRARRGADMPEDQYMATRTTSEQKIQSLAAAVDKLTSDFGTWKTAWGDINRFQRLTGDIVQPFNDAGPSIPVPFTSSRWGSLASFGARAYPGTKKWYGTSGNSFVAVVEFGDSVRAKAITAGGESGHPQSKHFNDEAARYASGDLRDVYFYKSQLKGHTEREYHPGS